MSSSDDDDVPLASLMARSGPAAQQSPAPAAAAEETLDSPAGRRKRTPSARVVAVSAASARKPPARGSKKRAHDSEDDDDNADDKNGGDGSEDDEDDDDEGDDDDDFASKRKGKAKPRAKTPVKRATTPKPKPVKKETPKAEKKPAAKRATAAASAADGSTATSKRSKSATPAAPKKAKEMKQLELLDQAMKSFKWWDAAPLPRDERWTYIEHNGVYFAPDYVRHNVKMKYDGREIELATADQEEMATFYAGIAPDGPQLGDPKKADMFNRNFFRDFKTILGSDHVIQDFSKCDFGPIRAYLEVKKEEKKALTKDDKEKTKLEKEGLQRRFGFAILDNNRIEKLGNTTIEPPGLFRGRGEHPKMGSLKQRVMPEDITINIAKGAPVPRCPLPGHNWKRVVHDPTVTWLAYWRENVMGSFKYVFLAASSSFKGKSDMAKYDKARRLCLNIDRIRATYERDLKHSEDPRRQQLATAMWIIDRLALRVGNEKDEDEADTVGCCSLRVEHMSFPSDDHVELSFLGKDSMPYHQVIDLSRFEGTGHQVFKNLRKFASHKKPTEDVFDMITTTLLNKELTNMMPGLSAKVFRTYNASVTLERELAALDINTPVGEKVIEYNRANREVAILCNHQRTVPKGFQEQFGKMQAKFDQLRSQLTELEAMKASVKRGADVKLKSESEDKEVKAAEAHLFAKQPTAAQVDTRIKQFEKKQRDMELTMKLKDDNKTVALGTAKINYMDPRITVAWCKRVECPIERVFAKTLRDKFPWAMSVPETWTFIPTGAAVNELADNAAGDDDDDDDKRGGGGAGDDDDDEGAAKPKSRARSSGARAKPAASKRKPARGGAGADDDEEDEEDDDELDEEEEDEEEAPRKSKKSKKAEKSEKPHRSHKEKAKEREVKREVKDVKEEAPSAPAPAPAAAAAVPPSAPAPPKKHHQLLDFDDEED